MTAIGSHDYRSTAIVDLAVCRDEVVQLVLLLRVKSNAQDVRRKSGAGQQTEKCGDLHSGVQQGRCGDEDKMLAVQGQNIAFGTVYLSRIGASTPAFHRAGLLY